MTIQLFPSTSIDDPNLSDLIQQRFDTMCCDEEYDPDIHGLIFLVEPGDSIAEVGRVSGCPITHDPFTRVRHF